MKRVSLEAFEAYLRELEYAEMNRWTHKQMNGIREHISALLENVKNEFI